MRKDTKYFRNTKELAVFSLKTAKKSSDELSIIAF